MRNNNVDILKGTGIILVVAGHEIKGLSNSNMLGESELFWMHIYDFIYIFHMPLFFFLSGFLYFNIRKDTNILNFITSKIASLYIPYLVFMVIRIISNILMNEYVNHTMTWSDFYSIFYKPTSVYWFLLALLKVNIFVFLADKVLKNDTLIFIVILIITGTLYKTGLYNDLLPFFEFVFIFYCGKMMSKYLVRFSGLNIFLLLFLAISSYFFFVTQYQILTALFFILFLYKAADLINPRIYPKVNETLALFGRESMVIYLTHVFFITGIRIVLSRFSGINLLAVHFLIGIPAGVILPVLMYHAISKVRFIDFIFYPNKYLQPGKRKTQISTSIKLT